MADEKLVSYGDAATPMPDPIALMPIPLVDVRDGGTARHAREGEARAKALRDECVAWFPGVARPLVPLIDALARRWLTRSKSPLAAKSAPLQVRSAFPASGFSTVRINGAVRRWRARRRRTVAGPHAGLALSGPRPQCRDARHARGGRRVLQRHQAGLRCARSLRWRPAVLPPRSIRRRSSGAAIIRGCAAATSPPTRCGPTSACGISAGQLLRQVFETCRDYGEARTVLERMPIARPVIYTVAAAIPASAASSSAPKPARRFTRTSPAPPTTGFTLSRCGKAASAAPSCSRGPTKRPRREAAPGAGGAGRLARRVRSRKLCLDRAAGAQ